MTRTTELAVSDQARLVAALRADPTRLDAADVTVALTETHISWVLLAGDFAYKIKKAVDFGFLDFSTLDKRHCYCQEELRLNRRLAPQLYLDVVPISGSVVAPQLNGSGDAVEYAVKMRRFPAAAQFDLMLAQGTLEASHIAAVARRIADFHRAEASAAPDSPYGAATAIHQPSQQNFLQIRPHLDQSADLARLQTLLAWSENEFERLKTIFAQRKQKGFIRECHGDLHLGNLALFEGEVAPFDCIEFNDNLRWIDVISEIAFLVMDLHDRRRPDFAWRLLNAYLEQTGDYAGLAVLRYYLVYRALVRAKVACLSSAQDVMEGAALEQFRDYLALADTFTRPSRPFIIITHGLSGVGKTTLAGELATTLGAIHIRSDIERKRLFGLDAGARSGSELDAGLYTAQAHQQTYRRLAELAQTIVEAGFPAIVDAAFLKHAEREAFRQLAVNMKAGFVLLDLQAPPEILQQRIEQREKQGLDASEATIAVLHRQLTYDEPVAENEKCRAIRVETRHSSNEEIMAATERLLAQEA
jgi:aminoglycoside phosphotransferase family enzyme/predicted kinase